MKVNIEHTVISMFICVAMISQGIIGAADTNEDPDPNGLYGAGGIKEVEELVEPTYGELVEKVNTQERRIVRLELIIGVFKSLGIELNDPMFETEIDATVDEIIGAEPRKTNIFAWVVLIGALILLVVGIAVLTIRLTRR